MGAGPQNVLTSGTITNPTMMGSVGGAATATLLQTNLPSYMLTGGSGVIVASGNTSTESAYHSHSGSGTTGGMNANNPHTHSAGTRFQASEGDDGNPGNYIVTNNVQVYDSNKSGTISVDVNLTNIDHGHSFAFSTGTQSAPHSHSFNVEGQALGIGIASGGSGAAFSKLPPAILFMIYIRL